MEEERRERWVEEEGERGGGGEEGEKGEGGEREIGRASWMERV